MSSLAPVFRSLASMHRAGIPWPRALESAAGSDARLRAAARALDAGQGFAEALRPHVDALDAALLEAAEHDGSLETTLTEMAEAHEEASRQRREQWTAFLYPLLVVHLAALLLPLPDLLRGRPLAALGWAAAVLVPTWTAILWTRHSARRSRPTPGAGNPPDPPGFLWGPIRNRVEEADARALDALGRLYDAGVPVATALDLAIPAGWGGRAAADLAEARRRVGRGRDLAGAWSHLPADLAGALRSAEEAGALGGALRRAAAALRLGVAFRRRRAAVVLPVLAVLALGLVVALRVFGFYGELYGGLPLGR